MPKNMKTVLFRDVIVSLIGRCAAEHVIAEAGSDQSEAFCKSKNEIVIEKSGHLIERAI